MHFDLDDEQHELLRSARRFLREQAPSATMRQWLETDEVLDPTIWKRLTEELGWIGIPLPESAGGFGFSWLDFALILEECGRALLPAPVWTSAALGAGSVLELGTDEQCAELLPDVAAGSTIATLALTESGGKWNTENIRTRFAKDGDGYVLNGEKTYVPWAHVAGLFVVIARDEDGELAGFAIPKDTDGLSVTRLATMDMTRPQGTVTLDGVKLDENARLSGADDVESALQHALDRAAILLSAELLGIAEATMDISVEYSKERVQFGRPIGSFQAIKHKCANMLMYVEACRSAVWYGGWEASQDDMSLAETAHVTKGFASDIAYRNAADTIQVLGGIGITWEHDAHFYFKRARASAQLLGNTSQHRESLYQNIIAKS